MATEIGKAYVQIMPSASGIKSKIEEILGPVDGAGESAGRSLGSKIVAGIKAVVATAAIGKMIQASLMEGANLQQSLGGVETMFKNSADTVVKNAKNAYKTAGLSANQYMEQVTSFSASLLQGLGGDTVKAAKYADMAVTDMGDNANKFGTNIQDIQNAYQGFAKQNYTMLDNLKLGYGGTKSEMERLIQDANRVKEANGEMADLSIESFADIVEAINWVQRDLGVFGTTSQEAAETFSGSFQSMKAAAQNVLGNLSLGEDLMPSLIALAETTSTFFFGNFLPMVGNILKGLPVLVGGLIKEGVAQIVEQAFGKEFANQIRSRFDGIGEVFGRIWEKLQQLAGKVREFAGEFDLVEAGKVIVEGLMTTLETLAGFLETAVDGLSQFVDWLGSGTPAADAFQAAVVAVGAGLAAWKISSVIASLGSFSGMLTTVSGAFTGLVTTISAGIASIPLVGWIAAAVAGLIWFFTQTETGKEMWSNFVEWAKQLWEGLKEFFSNLWDAIKETASNLWEGVQNAWQSAVESVKNIWNGITEFFSNLWETIKAGAEAGWNMLVAGITAIVQPFIDTFMQYWTAMSDGLSQIWDGIKMVFEGAWELIKSIVMGAVLLICDLITGDFDQMGADLALIWDSIKAAIETIWEGIKTYFSGVIETIVSFALTWFENFKTNLSNIWENVKTLTSAAWEWIKSKVEELITNLVNGAKQKWEDLKTSISTIVENIKTKAVNTWNEIKSSVQQKVDELVNGAKRAWEDLKRSVQETVDRVRSIFDGLSSIDLGAAGRAIMDSFLGGLKAAWGAVQEFVGGIADWIRKNKGPIEYDRKLLIPAGRAIMGGLDESLQDKFSDVKKTVSGMAPALADAFGDEALQMDLSPSVENQLLAESSFQQNLAMEKEAGVLLALERVEGLLSKILDKDVNTYLDGELLARDSYERHAQMMLREGI